MNNPVPQMTTLPNGLRVVTYHVPYVQTVSLGLWVGAGSRCETPVNNGIAHFLEHMAFKGTTTRSAFDIARQIEAVGGDLNAATSQDLTYYYASLLKEDTHLGIEILADILQNSTFQQDEMEKERNVVLQEIDQTNDTPDDVIFDHFQSVAFPGQPLGRPILGTPQTVKSFTKEMLTDFIHQHYHPSEMVFAAAGNLESSPVADWVEQAFSFSPCMKGPQIESSVYQGGYSHVVKDLEQQHFVLGFEGVPLTHPDFYLAHCYAGLLGGGMSSRLFQEVREKRGLVYGISAFSSSYQEAGLFGIYTGTSENKLEEIIKIIFSEIEKTTFELMDEEVDRAKNQLKASILMAQESTFYWANTLARQILTWGQPRSLPDMLSRIDSIDKDDLQRYAAQLLKGKPSVAFIGSRKEHLII